MGRLELERRVDAAMLDVIDAAIDAGDDGRHLLLRVAGQCADLAISPVVAELHHRAGEGTR